MEATPPELPAAAEPSPPPARRGRRALRVAAVGLAVLAAGCAGAYFGLLYHLPLPAGARAATPLPPEVDAALRNDPAAPIEVALGDAIDVDGHRVVPGRFASRLAGVEKTHEVTFHFYLADDHAEGRRLPAVIVTPILGGPNEVAKIIADDLASHGMHAVIVDRPGHIKRPDIGWEALEQGNREVVADRRSVIDWLLTRPEVDADRIAAYGVSLGGIATVMLTAAEPRVKASVAIMPGGDLPAVIGRSVERECRVFSRANGLPEQPTDTDLAAFEQTGRAVLRTCPLVLAPHVDPRRMLLFVTRWDSSVPSFTQQRLREALGEPETWSLPTGHYGAIIYLPLVKKRAREFLIHRLGADAAPGAG